MRTLTALLSLKTPLSISPVLYVIAPYPYAAPLLNYPSNVKISFL
jgi:hypothetical protein